MLPSQDSCLLLVEILNRHAICAELCALLLREWAAANRFNWAALDGTGDVFSHARIASVEVHNEIELPGVVFFRAVSTDSGLPERLRRIEAREDCIKIMAFAG